MSELFSPIQLRGLEIRNRIVMAPMCIYQADETGEAHDIHLVYYGSRALGGVGLLNFEATSVSYGGRNTQRDLGIWDDGQIEGLSRIIKFCQQSGAATCIQLAHSGRKSWADKFGVGPEKPIAPSAVPQGAEWVVPVEMTKADIQDMVKTFQDAAARVIRAGIDCLEIHAAHGYLIHQFLSPVSNKRTDEYGGSPTRRLRFAMEVTEAVREVMPAEMPLVARLSVVDWCDEGLQVEDSVEIAKALKTVGVDIFDCSSGGILEDKPQRLGPGYQLPFSKAIKKSADVMTMAVGSIAAPELAEEIILNERADMVALGRELLHNPHWPLDAARNLGVDGPWPGIFAAGKSSLGCR
jgi:NADPH2 dehydrogenase